MPGEPTGADNGAKAVDADAKGKTFADARRPLLPCASDRRLVRALLPAIRRKREAGWTYAQVRQALAESFGFKGQTQTLRAYVSQFARPPSRDREDAPPAPRSAPEPSRQK